MTSQDSDGSPRSSLARQIWLKTEGRSKAVELGEETEKEMEEKVMEWMQAEKMDRTGGDCLGRNSLDHSESVLGK